MKYELGLIGAGNMAEAIARGVLSAGIFKAEQMIVADVTPQRREFFFKELGIQAVGDNATVVAESRNVILSVKPYQIKEVLSGIGAAMKDETLVISIAAGISSGSIERGLGEKRNFRVIRTMPNTPMLVGEGMVAISAGKFATAADLATARRIFEAAATVIEVAETQIDAVTALSGSGPAYFFYFVEQMTQAGMELGLSAEHAHQLATRTAMGAATMMLKSGDSPAELRRKVVTPGGTTQAALETMDAFRVGPAIVAAIKRAAERSRELGQ